LNNFDGFSAFVARVFINGHAALITHPRRDGKMPRPNWRNVLMIDEIRHILTELGEDPAPRRVGEDAAACRCLMRYLTSGYQRMRIRLLNGAMFDVAYRTKW
jgi:hypothetical protein